MANVLIVDDDASVVTSLAAYLEDWDHEVTTAGDAEQAIRYAGEQRFDIAVVDLRLPVMNGEQLIQELHARCGLHHFLIHTGAVHYTLPEALTNLGIEPHQVLYKPLYDLGLLRQAVTAELANL